MVDKVTRHVRTVEDVLDLMDGLFEAGADRWTSAHGGSWWDGFYADRDRPIPFFVDKPDENLVDLVERGTLRPGRALDLGCGPGRNALYLAQHGFEVDAIDLSAEAIEWARERAERLDLPVRFQVGDAFTAAGIESLDGPYDLVHDSGCLHHLAPHRRVAYLRLLERHLAPGGHVVIVCFARGEMGSELDDGDLYLHGGLEGGLSFDEADLRWLLQDLDVLEVRPMVDQPADSATFGEPFLLTALARRP